MRKFFWVAIILLGLGGILAAFFILTTKMSKPEPVVVYAPETEPQNNIRRGKVFNLVLDGDRVYKQDSENRDKLTPLDTAALANFLQNLQPTYGDQYTVVIKPTPKATYRATVDLLDQMTIHGVKSFLLEE